MKRLEDQTDSELIDAFIKYNTNMLVEMDRRNKRDYAFYATDADCLDVKSHEERTRAATRILNHFFVISED